MDKWYELYNKAKSVQHGREISPFIYGGQVATAILTKQGNIYMGVCIEATCGLAVCAERNAIFQMITNGEYQIDKVVTIAPNGKVVSPCGACRELMMQLDKSSVNIEILVDYEERRTIRLKDLIPDWWGQERFR